MRRESQHFSLSFSCEHFRPSQAQLGLFHPKVLKVNSKDYLNHDHYLAHSLSYFDCSAAPGLWSVT